MERSHNDSFISSTWPLLAGAVFLGWIFIKRQSFSDQKTKKYQDENDKLKKEIDKLNLQNEELKIQLKEKSNNLEQFQIQEIHKKQLYQNEETIFNLNNEINQLKLELSKLEENFINLRTENEKLRNQPQKTDESILNLTNFDKYDLSKIENLNLSQNEVQELKSSIENLEQKLSQFDVQIEEEKEKLDKDFSEVLNQKEEIVESSKGDNTFPQYSDKDINESKLDTNLSYKTETFPLNNEEKFHENIPSTSQKNSHDDLATQLNLPDDAMELASKSNIQETSFDLSVFKKRGSSKKGMKLDLEKFLNSEDNNSTNLGAGEISKIDKVEKDKKPSFMNIFMNGNSIGPIVEEKKELTPWKSGDPLIRDYAVKEDMNAKGAKKTKKKVGFGSASSKGCDMEDQNYIEFPFASDPKKALFCVFDGHGGKDCAIQAKKNFSSVFQKYIKENCEDFSSALSQTFLDLDSQLSEFEYLGCTATVVLIWQIGENRYLQAANVGDSTAFLNRGKNGVLWLTRDHKATNEEEKERIRSSGAELTANQTRVTGGLAVSRALGDHFLKQEKVGLVADPYVSPSIKLEPSDSIAIIASDGLWDVMTGEEAMKIVEPLNNAESMSKWLIQKAMQHPKCTDNITVMVVVL